MFEDTLIGDPNFRIGDSCLSLHNRVCQLALRMLEISFHQLNEWFLRYVVNKDDCIGTLILHGWVKVLWA